MFIQKNKAKVSFQKRFSSSDHLNVINRNTDIYFNYIVDKTRRKNCHQKAILQLRACCWYQKNTIETVVFVLGKAVRLLLKLYLKTLNKILGLNINQKWFIFQVKLGLNQLVSMEPEMFLPSTIFGHVA